MAQSEKLWSKTLVALMCVNFIGALVFYLLMVELVGYCTSTFGVSTSLAALPITAYVISALVARILLGHKVDEWGPMRSLVYGLVLNAVSCIGYLLPFGFSGLVVMRVVHGFGLALSSAAASAGAILIIPANRRAEGIGYFSMAQALGTGVGPFFAVLLTTLTSGYRAIFIFAAAISLVALLFLAIIRLPRIEEAAAKAAHRGAPKLGDLIQLDAVPVSLVTVFVFFCYSGVGSFVVEYAASEAFSTISMFFLLYAICIVVTRPIAGKRVDRLGENSTIYITLASLVVGFLLLAVAPNGAVFLLSAAFLGVGVGTTQSIVQAIIARDAPAAEQGRANSTFLMSLDIGSGIGPMIIGAVLGLVTYRQMYLVLTGFALATVALYYFVHGRKAGH